MRNKCPKINPFSNRDALRSSVVVSLVLNLVLLVGVFFGRSRSFMVETDHLWEYVYFFIWHFGFNVLLFYILFRYNFYILKKARTNTRRSIWIVAGALLLPALISPLLARIQWWVMGFDGDFMDKFILFNCIKDVFASMMVLMMTSIIYLSYKREQTVIANQKLHEENIRTRYEALKNQLDPHFLFNSLNTLNGLVGTDDDKAHEYIDNLSSVFRYTLHSKNIGTLDKEMEYVDAYLSLLRIRYGDNLEVKYNVGEKYRQYHIMPASLQLLVENAVKHNTISNGSPLRIIIWTTDRDSIVVSNRINPKVEQSMGGLGLANLTDRYSILFGKNIIITNHDGVFSVEVPLVGELDKSIRI